MNHFTGLYARPPPLISGYTPISINFAVVKLTTRSVAIKYFNQTLTLTVRIMKTIKNRP